MQITLVVPWYGDDTTGGAETQARNLARALHAQGSAVAVWASTGRDSFHPTATAHYPAGHSTLDGIPLWRFRPSLPDARGIPHFFAQHPHLLPPLAYPKHELDLLGSLLSSDELYAAIVREQQQRVFVFLPYPFPTTFWGAMLAPQRSVLLPCLHDEPYAYYQTYHTLMQQVRGVLANSPAEADLARRLYTLPDHRLAVPGEGIDLTPIGDGARFRRQFVLADGTRLLLYVGRRDASKNIPLLLTYMREYWAQRGDVAKLLLIGRGDLPIPPRMDARQHADAPVFDLGFQPEHTKHDAYAAADLFVLPSTIESFSIVLMEAWLQGTPALVNAACAVTADHVQRSGGGVTFDRYATFAAALDVLLPQPALRATLGARGAAYVRATCDWHTVARETYAAIDRFLATPPSVAIAGAA